MSVQQSIVAPTRRHRLAELPVVVDEVVARSAELVAVSGIEVRGTRRVAARLVEQIEARGLSAAVVHVDDWLRCSEQRFRRDRSAEHFYEHAVRISDMFEERVLPLLERGRTDLVVLEGIFLLKRALRAHYDYTVWIDCSIETALERTLRCRQTDSVANGSVAHEVIYFAAQRVHARLDDPRAAADAIVSNDPRIELG